MLFVGYLLVLLVAQFSHAKLVVDANCDLIKFQRLFTNPPVNNRIKAYGHIYHNFTQKQPDQTILIFPLYEPNFNSPVSVLIYKKNDSRFISNMPKNIKDVESWGDSFGICTQEDINLGKCNNIGEFKVELSDQSIRGSVINKYLYFEESEKGRLMGVSIELEMGSFCYITAFNENKNEQKQEKASETHIPDTRRKKGRNRVSMTAMDNAHNNTRGYLNFYAHVIFSIIQFLLSIFIWFKIKSDNKREINIKNLKLSTPYKNCLAIVIVSLTSSILHMFYVKIGLTLYETASAVGENTVNSPSFKLLKVTAEIFETVDDILIYLLCFQFVNLDSFGLKINFRKNKFGLLFIGVLFWTLIVHPFIMDYRFKLLFAIRTVFKGNQKRNRAMTTLLIKCVQVFDLLNYIIIWYILYKTSQKTENNFLVNDNKLKRYCQKFKLMRIWLVFSAIVLKFIGFILNHYMYRIFLKLHEYIFLEIEENSYRGGSELILSNIVLIFLKGFLSILRTFNIFALPILIIITLRIWWNYDEVKFEEIEMVNQGLS